MRRGSYSYLGLEAGPDTVEALAEPLSTEEGVCIEYVLLPLVALMTSLTPSIRVHGWYG